MSFIVGVVVVFTAVAFGVLGIIGNSDPERSDPPPPTFKAAIKRVAIDSAYLAMLFVAMDFIFHRDQFWERIPTWFSVVVIGAALRLAIDWFMRHRAARKPA